MDGSIIAVVITTHMARNDAAAPGHVSNAVAVHVIDDVAPPCIVIPSMADITQRAYASR
jgi:hypothetical protein